MYSYVLHICIQSRVFFVMTFDASQCSIAELARLLRKMNGFTIRPLTNIYIITSTICTPVFTTTTPHCLLGTYLQQDVGSTVFMSHQRVNQPTCLLSANHLSLVSLSLWVVFILIGCSLIGSSFLAHLVTGVKLKFTAGQN